MGISRILTIGRTLFGDGMSGPASRAVLARLSLKRAAVSGFRDGAGVWSATLPAALQTLWEYIASLFQ